MTNKGIEGMGRKGYDPLADGGSGYRGRTDKRRERQNKTRINGPLNGRDSRKPERDSGNRPGGFPKNH